MKKISKIAVVVLVVAVLLVYIGNTRKGSRTWIENKVSDIERVYPTENLEDLFEKFPNGFIISQTRLFDENGKTYRLYIEVEGEKENKVIKGKVSKTLLQSEPYKEIVEKESEVEYKKGENLVLANPELTEELLPKNYFLFQELELNKNVFKKLEDKGGTFSYETNKYEIVYKINNGKINNYLGFSNEEVSMEVIGQYSESDKTYFHTLVINDKDKKLYFFEKVVEDKGNAEDYTE